VLLTSLPEEIRESAVHSEQKILIQDSPSALAYRRWVDSYTVPGQFVGVRYPPDPVGDATAAAASAAEEALQNGAQCVHTTPS